MRVKLNLLKKNADLRAFSAAILVRNTSVTPSIEFTPKPDIIPIDELMKGYSQKPKGIRQIKQINPDICRDKKETASAWRLRCDCPPWFTLKAARYKVYAKIMPICKLIEKLFSPYSDPNPPAVDTPFC
jgi:hypothetical protein